VGNSLQGDHLEDSIALGRPRISKCGVPIGALMRARGYLYLVCSMPDYVVELTDPAARQVQIAGTLDRSRDSNSAFTLLLHDAERTSLRGYLSGTLRPHVLVPYWGKEVTLSVLVHIPPSGAPLRIEAQHIRAGTRNDLAVFSEVPQLIEAHLNMSSIKRQQGPSTGINAIFGHWPGDESEEEIIAALERAK
jgi:hypothetical protein